MATVAPAGRVRASVFGKLVINLSLSSAVLEAAKHLDINMSQVCDQHLREVVLREQTRRWRTEHADFMADCNATLEVSESSRARVFLVSGGPLLKD